MTEQRLFRLAPEALTLGASFVHGEGWRVHIRMRRADEGWESASDTTYSHLTTEELADVVCSEVLHQLRLS